MGTRVRLTYLDYIQVQNEYWFYISIIRKAFFKHPMCETRMLKKLNCYTCTILINSSLKAKTHKKILEFFGRISQNHSLMIQA